MFKSRRLRPLAYAFAFLLAPVLATRGIAHDMVSHQQFGSVLAVLVGAMVLGLLVTAHGLLIDRHAIRALAMRRIEIRRRMSRRNRQVKVRRHFGPALQVPALTADTAFSVREWIVPGSIFRHPRTYP
jgi:hypothetical protein